MIMNEHEIRAAADGVRPETHPQLARAARILEALCDWTNSNSDGWPYWAKPRNASSRLQVLVDTGTTWNGRPAYGTDLTAREVYNALTPIKAFLTRQHVDQATRDKILRPSI